jgi:hypothetical protein
MKILVDMNLSPGWVDFLIEASDAGCGLSGERGRLNIHAEAVVLLRESGVYSRSIGRSTRRG